MDLVTQSLLSSFRQEESLPDEIDEPTVFEHFVNFISVSSEYSDEFDVEDIHTGGGDDLGIETYYNSRRHGFSTSELRKRIENGNTTTA
jgi:hypothetical protein